MLLAKVKESSYRVAVIFKFWYFPENKLHTDTITYCNAIYVLLDNNKNSSNDKLKHINKIINHRMISSWRRLSGTSSHYSSRVAAMRMEPLSSQDDKGLEA